MGAGELEGIASWLLEPVWTLVLAVAVMSGLFGWLLALRR